MNTRKVFVVPSLAILSLTEGATGAACKMFEAPGSSTVPAATTLSLCGHLEDIFAPHNHRDDESDEPTTLSYASASGGSNVSAGVWRSSFTVAQPETLEPRFVIRLQPEKFCGHLRSQSVPSVVIDADGVVTKLGLGCDFREKLDG
jgi:hypothetical protein